MFTIDTFTSIDKGSSRPRARTRGTSANRAFFDTWTLLTLPVPRGRRVTSALSTAAGVAVVYLTVIPRRFGDRLFAMNDAEAYWPGLQIIRRHTGLTRRYRDPAFPVGSTAGCDNHPPITGWLSQPADRDTAGDGPLVVEAGGAAGKARDCRKRGGGLQKRARGCGNQARGCGKRADC